MRTIPDRLTAGGLCHEHARGRRGAATTGRPLDSQPPQNRRSPSFQQHLLVYVRMFVHVRRRDGKLISLTGELRTFGGSTARRVEDQLTLSSDGNFVLAYFDSLVDAVHALDSSLREARSGRRRKRFHGRRQPALDDGEDVNRRRRRQRSPGGLRT